MVIDHHVRYAKLAIRLLMCWLLPLFIHFGLLVDFLTMYFVSSCWRGRAVPQLLIHNHLTVAPSLSLSLSVVIADIVNMLLTYGLHVELTLLLWVHAVIVPLLWVLTCEATSWIIEIARVRNLRSSHHHA